MALAQERKFHKAALASHITQPTLSSAFRQLAAKASAKVRRRALAASSSRVSGKRDDA